MAACFAIGPQTGIPIHAQIFVCSPECRGDKGGFVYGYFILQFAFISYEDKKNKEAYERFGKHFTIPIFTE
jgi:hypothetical protein